MRPTASTLRSCPVCLSGQVKSYHRDDRISLSLCAACGLKFQDPVPDASRLADIYDNAYYQDLYPEAHLAEQKRLFAHRLRWLERWTGARRLSVLEVGSGRGMFLEAALERGHQVTGQDLSQAAALAIRERLGVPVLCGEMEQLCLADESFDLIHINHVLEHMPCPGRTLALLRRLLKPGGTLYVEVPRQSNLLNRLSGMVAGKDFGFTYHPGHLFLFSPASLAMLLRDVGLAPDRVFIEGMAAPHRFVRGVHYHGTLAHLVKLVAGGLRLERLLGGGNLAAVSVKSGRESAP